MRIAPLLLGCLLWLACDPGFHYSPRDWREVSDHTWQLELPELRAKMISPGGLIGSTALVPSIDVTNRTDDPIVFETVSLTTRGDRYDGHFSGNPDPRWRTIPPRASTRIDPFIELGKPLYESLGTRLVLDLTYRIGTRPAKSLRVDLERSED